MFPDGPASEQARESPRILCIRRCAYQIDRERAPRSWAEKSSTGRSRAMITRRPDNGPGVFPFLPRCHGPHGPVPCPLPLFPAQVVVVASTDVVVAGMVVVAPAGVVVVDWTVDVVAPAEVEVVARDVVGDVGGVVGDPAGPEGEVVDGLVWPVVGDPAGPEGEVGDGSWGRNPVPIELVLENRGKGCTTWIPEGSPTPGAAVDEVPFSTVSTWDASTSAAVERSAHQSTPSITAARMVPPTAMAVAPAINRPTNTLSRRL